jgi:hypothetical protein
MAAAEDERLQPIAVDAPSPLAGGSGVLNTAAAAGGSWHLLRASDGVDLDGDGHLVGDDVVDR